MQKAPNKLASRTKALSHLESSSRLASPIERERIERGWTRKLERARKLEGAEVRNGSRNHGVARRGFTIYIFIFNRTNH